MKVCLPPLQFLRESSIVLSAVATASFVDAGDAKGIALRFYLGNEGQRHRAVPSDVDIAQQPARFSCERPEFYEALPTKVGHSHLARDHIRQSVSKAVLVSPPRVEQIANRRQWSEFVVALLHGVGR